MTQRRRFISIVAACAGATLLGAAAARDGAPVTVWKGTTLGALASMTLVHPDRARARTLIDECLQEIERLEKVFSLYRADSALCRLNAAGRLRQPPLELVELLGLALSLSHDSAGAFDPTVQPLYLLYADHFARPRPAPGGPSRRDIERVLPAVDYRAVDLAADGIVLRKPGMGLTLNGVAQGYVTDRVADRLRAAGLEHLLIDLGEIRAVGQAPGGRPWEAGIADPRQPDRTATTLTLGEGGQRWPALATSGGYGMQFGPDPSVHHLFDPHTGRSANRHLSVSVNAPRATLADGLSTALAVLPRARAIRLLARHRPASAYFIDSSGAVSILRQAGEGG